MYVRMRYFRGVERRGRACISWATDMSCSVKALRPGVIVVRDRVLERWSCISSVGKHLMVVKSWSEIVEQRYDVSPGPLIFTKPPILTNLFMLEH